MLIKIDDVDKEIIWFMWNLNPDSTVTTSDIAKNIFRNISTNAFKEKNYELKKKDAVIRQKLVRLVKYGLVVSEKKDSKMRYVLNGNSVICGPGTIRLGKKVKKAKIILVKSGEETNIYGSVVNPPYSTKRSPREERAKK